MWRFRLLWLPFGIVIELLVFASALFAAWISPKTAEKITRWAFAHLPSMRWYIGEE